MVTGTRAEYGLLYWLIKAVQEELSLDLQLIATCMHLSPEFGLTYKDIEQDGFKIDEKIEMLLSADTPSAISKSMGLGIIGFADAFARLRPDVVILLGDRFEALSAAIAAMNARIPIAHIHGGELTLGVIDEAIRHSITKMSHLHFASTNEYRDRIIQLGEDPNKVFNVGALGVYNIKKLNLLDKLSLEQSLEFKFHKKNLLVTFHPVTVNKPELQFQSLLSALEELSDTQLIFTKANADAGGRKINQLIDQFIQDHPDRAVSFVSLGYLRYLSILQFVDGVIGNSSSGLIEAPSFKIGTINIGDRQQGRIRPNSVIDCLPETRAIRSAIVQLYSAPFQKTLEIIINPYEGKNTVETIINILKNISLIEILKKSFYDLRKPSK